jgi:hypothetical protein
MMKEYVEVGFRCGGTPLFLWVVGGLGFCVAFLVWRVFLSPLGVGLLLNSYCSAIELLGVWLGLGVFLFCFGV